MSISDDSRSMQSRSETSWSMQSVDETLSNESVDKTLVLHGTSMATIDALLTDPPTSEASREALQKKRGKLMDQIDALESHRGNLRTATQKMYNGVDEIDEATRALDRLDILQDALISFVDKIEKANQYLELKETAKQKYNFKYSTSSSTWIIDTLLHDQQLKFKFNKIGEDEMEQAGDAIYWELCDEHDGLLGMQFGHQDEALEGWFNNLVFQAREKGYVMDNNPIAELEKMMKSEPYEYDNYFRNVERPVKCTKSLTEQANNKYAEILKNIEAYSGAKTAVEKAEDVSKALEKQRHYL